MRVIRGRFKGFRLPEYKGKNTRPTSDLVKESLFNTLEAYLDFEGIRVLDLFAGTGNIGIECISRGAASLLSVDHMNSNVRYMKDIKKKLDLSEWTIIGSDVLDFVSANTDSFDFIFADPPYDYAAMHDMVNRILSSEWFRSGNSVFVLEHPDRLVFNHKEVFLNKQYGNSSFTCFRSILPSVN